MRTSHALRRIGCGGLILAALAVAPAAGAETRQTISVFAGQMTDNEWGDLFDDWGSVATRDARQLGGSLALERRLGPIGHIGIEATALRHFGEQTHFEFTLPVFVRTPRFDPVWVPSIGYGVGLSYATEPSRTEIARTGSSARLLAHWFLEAEFGNDRTPLRPFIRLHHRSDAAGTFDADTGSNAVFLGLRFPLN